MVTEAACTSETSVNFCHTTRRNIPEDIRLHLASVHLTLCNPSNRRLMNSSRVVVRSQRFYMIIIKPVVNKPCAPH
jgi:hypothetical protein